MGIFTNINKAKSENLSFFDKSVLGVKTKNNSNRPGDGFLSMNKDAETVLSERINIVRYQDLWNLSKISDVLQIVFNTRARKTFKEGFDIDANFEQASSDQEKEIKKWISKCNQNGQSLKEVFHELDKDLNWADDAYLLCLKDYGFNKEGVIVVSEVKEFLRVHPLSIELQMDTSQRLGRFNNTKNGEANIAYFNPNDRLALTSDEFDKNTGNQNLQAHYKINSNDGLRYYNNSEVIHKSSFNPSLTYGYSPLFSLYQKVLVLMLQDSYIKKYYGDDKPTKGLLVFNTSNKTALMKTFDEIRKKTQQNPHGVKPIIAESSDGRKPVEYIDMAKTLDEMQFTSQRDEFRQQIGACYGVSPMFQNDMSTGGGLNNEGLQVTVTNEVITERQTLFNNSFVKFIFEDNLGFKDWKVNITPDIEQDLKADEELKALELQNAKTKLELGLKGRMTKDGDILFDKGELELDTSSESGLGAFNLGKNSVIKKADKNPLDFLEADDGIPKAGKTLDKKLNAELKKILGSLNLKGKPSKDKLLKAVGKISVKLEKQLKKVASSVFKGIYEKELRNTNKLIKTKPEFTNDDKETLDFLKSDDKYKEAFAGLSIANSMRLNDSIVNAFTNGDISIDNLVKSVENDLEATKSDLRKIVRTQVGQISNASRLTQLKKTGAEYKYFHIGPNDNRTTKTSLNIEKRTKGGVSWEEYVKIVKEESKKEFPEWEVNPKTGLSHYQSRHTFLFKRIGDEK